MGKDQKDRKPDEGSAIVEPRKSRLDPTLHDPVVLCPVGPLVNLFARIHKAKKTVMPFEPGKAYTAKVDGVKLSLVGPCMGAPASAYMLERLIANGVRNVVMLGLCGSLSSKVKIGDIVVPDWALVEEGTSRHYEPNLKKSETPGKGLKAVEDAFAEAKKTYHKGPVWTTDAVFRETVGKVKKYGNAGILAVEMESSALFTIARHRGINLAAVLVVSDELFDLRWRSGFTRPRFLRSLRYSCRISARAALKMAGKDAGLEVNKRPPKEEPPHDAEEEEDLPPEEDDE